MWIPMDAEEEVRIDEQAFERELNAAVEAPTIAPAGVEEFEQRLRVAVRHGPAIREPRHLREDLRGARVFVFVHSRGPLCPARRLTHENRATGWRVVGPAACPEVRRGEAGRDV